MRSVPRVVPLLALLIASICSCSITPSNSVDLIIADITLYATPGSPPLRGASLAIKDGMIVAIGSAVSARSEVVLDGGGRSATAGLWNSHVHFTAPALETDAASEIHNMLLRYGFTSVVDTGSDLGSTLELASSIARGDLAGPRIFLANGSFVYTDGTPAYLPGVRLPEIDDPGKADGMVAEVMASGAQGIKIFAGSYMSPTETIHLPPEIVRAVTNAAHERGGFVISHPNDRTGLINSVENGVDVLAHTTPVREPLGDEMIELMLNNGVALIPTLKLWSYELGRNGTPEQVIQFVQRSAVAQLADYYAAGGEILFGTDTGYMRDFDTADEFMLMQQAGMDFDAILASMTTTPARRFADEPGTVGVGATADLVIYAGDPAADIAGFSRIQYTIRAGRLVYCADEGEVGSPCR